MNHCLCYPQPCSIDHRAKIDEAFERRYSPQGILDSFALKGKITEVHAKQILDILMGAEAAVRLTERHRAKSAVTPVVRHETIEEMRLVIGYGCPCPDCKNPKCESKMYIHERLKNHNPQ